MTKKLISLAFSGGLDTSWAVPWLREQHNAEVMTVTGDVGGFDTKARQELEARSRELGAVKHIHVDARELFFDEVIKHLIRGNVLRGHVYPLCVGAERSLQARIVAETAVEHGAFAVAHGCTGAGNDQVRFEVALQALAPDIEIMAPIRDQNPTRSEEVSWLESRGFAVPAAGAAYSTNSGLWGTTIGGRETLQTAESIPEEAWQKTRGAFDRFNHPLTLKIGFEAGLPVYLDGKRLNPVDLIETLDNMAAFYGIGRGIHLGDTIMGTKGRVAFEASAAEVILKAHRELDKLVLGADQLRVKDQLALTYGDRVHEGRGLEPICRDIEAFFASAQTNANGQVTCVLRTGSVFIAGVESPQSLHAAAKTIYGEQALDWNPRDAQGFNRIAALPSILSTRIAKGGGH